MKLPNKYGDFSALEDLIRVLESQALVVATGVYGEDNPEPGPHVSFSAPDVGHSFDFIRREDGSFILRIA